MIPVIYKKSLNIEYKYFILF